MKPWIALCERETVTVAQINAAFATDGPFDNIILDGKLALTIVNGPYTNRLMH